MRQIADIQNCSINQVSYWMVKYEIKRRTISESAYAKWNPNGDPFTVYRPRTTEEAILYGIGLGLYWGEGTKSNKHSIRLGNTDPRLIKAFIRFLGQAYAIKKSELRFGLQIFSNMPAKDVLLFWQKHLGVRDGQFMKTIVTPSRGEGTYKRKIQHGVLTVYFHNRKLRDILCGEIEKIK
jgi:hypothetical protein